MTEAIKGHVLWLTGLSGAGKSTIAIELIKLYQQRGIYPVQLDGDKVRAAISDPNWQFDIASRLRGSYIYARLAAMLSEQGHLVIVPTISMFHEVRQWNRDHISRYFEVYLKVSAQVRHQRDPKQLYQRYTDGQHAQMPGLDLAIEEPQHADLVLLNEQGPDSISAISQHIFEQLNVRFPQILQRPQSAGGAHDQ
ncbi:adenylyl-sulfate kinase [Rheinheimera marina]|uniref:Adenylyl-sulfate kinase n=1 Tax=Rheinheimera marina TaxID=1774958 RepID=A0ABV9JRM4_9GAMM